MTTTRPAEMHLTDEETTPWPACGRTGSGCGNQGRPARTRPAAWVLRRRWCVRCGWSWSKLHLPDGLTDGRITERIEKTIPALSNLWNETIIPGGSHAANVLGLTAQVPVQPVYITSGRDRKLKLGEQTVLLRHAPAWQLAAPHQPAGEAIRALAWLGPTSVAENIDAVRQKLTTEDLKELAASRARMPAWLTETVSELVAGA